MVRYLPALYRLESVYFPMLGKHSNVHHSPLNKKNSIITKTQSYSTN